MLSEGNATFARLKSERARVQFQKDAKRAQVLGTVRDVVAAVRLRRRLAKDSDLGAIGEAADTASTIGDGTSTRVMSERDSGSEEQSQEEEEMGIECSSSSVFSL